jgi:putative NADH-flavin reductase
MRLTIFAATGGVGRQLFAQALDAGHQVTAVVRNPLRLPTGCSANPAVRVVAMDMSDPNPSALKSAITGADAVLSCIGPHSNSDAGITAPATRAIITAMQTAGVTRIVAISASPVSTEPSPGRPRPPKHDPGDGFFARYVGERFVKMMFGKVYADLALMEDELRESGLDWTVLRPVKLTNKPLTERYRTSVGCNVRGGIFVSRADVAHLMLAAVDRGDTVHQVLGIAS